MPTATPLAKIKPADLPVPPQAALQVTRACCQENTNADSIAQLVASDPVLSAELLRIVNSALFGLAYPVQSIPQAIALLGLKALRNLVLCVAVREAFQAEQIKGFDITSYWEDALRRAVSAKVLGERAGLKADDCFTAGLLQDFGLLVLFYLQPDKGHQWGELRSQDPDARRRCEQETFGDTHDRIMLMLAQAWSLPEALARPLGLHHRCRQEELPQGERQLCKVLQCADWMTAVYTASERPAVVEQCRKLIGESFQLNEQHIEALFATLPDQVEEAAQALGLGIPPQSDYTDILKQANVQLAEDNLSYQELTWRLEKTLQERDRLAQELAQELGIAKEIQRALLPSGMPEDFPIAAVNIPARELSGDFFDYYLLGDGRIYFTLGDVAGKGITAALLMSKASSLFRCLGKEIQDPGRLFAIINNELCETSTRGMFVTMIAGLFDPRTGTLRLANAGHLPAIVFGTDGAARTIEAPAPPLGLLPDCEFPEQTAELNGGTLYLVSDGVTERRMGPKTELGLDGLINLIRGFQHESLQQQLEHIIATLESSTAAVHDDMTLLLLGQKPSSA